MMSNATTRAILRSIHLIVSIPVLGYVYGEPSEVAQYAGAARFVFVPVMILSGYWMYSGLIFALIGVAVWLGAYYLSGIGAAILSQVALFIARQSGQQRAGHDQSTCRPCRFGWWFVREIQSDRALLLGR
jgi:hypothetical protein